MPISGSCPPNILPIILSLFREGKAASRVTRAEATRKTDEGQKDLRQTLRTEVAAGGKGPDAQLDRWAITIRFEDENSGTE
jgi:hypothetical protein